jgi:hypothetical protein
VSTDTYVSALNSYTQAAGYEDVATIPSAYSNTFTESGGSDANNTTAVIFRIYRSRIAAENWISRSPEGFNRYEVAEVVIGR